MTYSWRTALERINDRFGNPFFYVLIALAGLSLPVLEFRGDFVTLFDLYLVAYLVVKLFTTGFRFDRKHWATLIWIFGLYLVFLSVGALRTFTPYSFLLLLKHVEYVAFLVVLLDHFARTKDVRRDLMALFAVLLLIVTYQLLYYFQLVPGLGETYRLGLPFMLGISSNPAGFFLGGTLIVLMHVGFQSAGLRTLAVPLAILALWTLALTISRTNILAFLVILTLTVLFWSWESRYRWLLIPGFLVLGTLFFMFVVPRLPTSGVLSRVIQILQDPGRILEENSFRVRREELWVKGFGSWLQSGWTVLFGAGLGIHERVDGTLPRLLGAQGVVGTMLFVYVWLVHYLWKERSPAVIFLLVFVLINGINAETLIVSYRSVQLHLVLLIAAVYGSRLLHGEQRSVAPETTSQGVDALWVLRVLGRRWPIVAGTLVLSLLPALLARAPEGTALAEAPLRLAIYLGVGMLVGTIAALLVDHITIAHSGRMR